MAGIHREINPCIGKKRSGGDLNENRGRTFGLSNNPPAYFRSIIFPDSLKPEPVVSR